MKRVYVNEDWCLACHLCEYYCAAANSAAVQCRHCETPLCVKSCITGALSQKDGVISCDESRCVGCYTCVLACPYGCIVTSEDSKVIQKCDLCMKNNNGEPALSLIHI